MVDYHIHTNLSDGEHSHDDILSKVIKSGLREFGFSDHLCLNNPDWAIKECNLEFMSDKIMSLKESMKSGIDVKFGLEVDYLEGRENEINEVLKQLPLDYVIGSVHYIGDWNFDTDINGYGNKDIEIFYLDYFNLLGKAAMSGLFDIMGHIDLAKKFNYYPKFDLDPFYKTASEIFSKANVAIELNTSGKDKPCHEFYPSDKFLEYCFVNNVPVTLGSDTHKIEHIARYFPEAILKLKKIGYKKLAVFTKRKRSYINL